LSRHPLIIGHRGAAGLAPENSLAGFARAIELGADGVECDIHLTSDGVPVVIHDAALGRTTDGKGPVAAHSAQAIRRLSLRRDGGAIPLLRDVAQMLAPTNLLLNAEIKTAARGRRYAGIEDAVARVLTECGMIGRAVVSSFDWNCVGDFIARARPGLALGLVTKRRALFQGGPLRCLARARRRGFDGICIGVDALKRRRIAAAERAAIWVYGVETDAQLDRVLQSGFAAIITDRPDLALIRREAIPARPPHPPRE
jgi:glycerophosphoryl diester phosphodiesterase